MGISEKPKQRPTRIKNDIRDIRSFRQLERVDLDLESPWFVQACNNLGIAIHECMKK